jgi:tetratricopeptide (TPR) repeat protein
LPSYFDKLTRFVIGSSFAFSLCTTAAEAQSTAADYEKLGQKQYSQANFKEAAASFRLAIYQGAKSASVWLYLGECYDRAGEVGAARQTYQTIQKHFPGTAECAKATERAAKLKVSSPVAPATAAAAEATPKTASSSASSGQKGLIDRIYIVPPRFGHAPVSNRTIRLVRSLLTDMPPTVYKILDQGKTNLFLTPNLMDRFPEVVGVKNDHLGIYFSQEHGRTYEHDVYLCERTGSGTGATTDVGPVLSDEVLKEFLYTLLSHALNGCLEMPSNDRQFIALYKQDYANLDPSDLHLHAFVAPVEGVSDTFAALCANIMGSHAAPSELCSRSFPRCRAWVAERIKLLSEKK